MTRSVRYTAEVRHAREVSLFGTADLAFWEDRLAAEELAPKNVDGRALIVVMAVAGKWMGIRFRELSICVFVAAHAAQNQIAAYMPQAFNSSRFFAFFEKNWFRTPYLHGEVRLETGPPASSTARMGDTEVFHARMAPQDSSRAPTRDEQDGWQGPIFIPSRAADGRPGKVFFGRVSGHTRTYAYSIDDTTIINPSPGIPALGWLEESRFRPAEWIVREDTVHARSKTVSRERAAQWSGE